MKCRFIFLVLFIVLVFPIGSIAKKDGRYTEMEWETLMPPDWNPAEDFADLNLDELDDDDPRAEEAMKKLRKMWDEAPMNPGLQGKTVSISGFVAPLDFTDRAELKEFLLVPYFGACIHLPPPPANQIIHVTLEKPRRGIRTMDDVTVYGKLAIETHESEMGRSGYSMKADAIEPYVEKR